ncbi:hypothetical protein EMCRGX_G012701 [Ephydatia muelleri]
MLNEPDPEKTRKYMWEEKEHKALKKMGPKMKQIKIKGYIVTTSGSVTLDYADRLAFCAGYSAELVRFPQRRKQINNSTSNANRRFICSSQRSLDKFRMGTFEIASILNKVGMKYTLDDRLDAIATDNSANFVEELMENIVKLCKSYPTAVN